MESSNDLPEAEKVSQPFTMPVIEEQVIISKKVVETGSITAKKQVTHETEAVHIPLLHDEYEVQHVPKNIFVDDAIPAMRQSENVTIIPVLKEVLVKRILLVEEIIITRRVIETTDEQEVELRRETVTVERQQTQAI